MEEGNVLAATQFALDRMDIDVKVVRPVPGKGHASSFAIESSSACGEPDLLDRQLRKHAGMV